MSNMTHHHAVPAVGLSEHLDYFNDNIVQTGDFDDIFGKDFDLVFDPELLTNNNASEGSMAPQSMSYSHHHSHHQPQQYDPIPVPVQSRSFVPPQTQQVYQPIQYTSNPSYVSAPAMVTPSAPPKPIAQVKSSSTTTKSAPKSQISKAGPATVSPVSVTAVFDSIPKAPAPTVAKSSPRKRSYAETEKPAPVTSASAAAPVDESNLSFEEQENLRRERNRHHAKKSRQRKRNYMNQLEDAVNDMRKENERLFDLLGMDSRLAKADMAKEEERKSERATEKFIAGLKQPRNRVLDNTTLAFLRELWK